jgi:hypothetical protein
MGNAVFAAKLLNRFVAQAPSDLRPLEEALMAADGAALAVAAFDEDESGFLAIRRRHAEATDWRPPQNAPTAKSPAPWLMTAQAVWSAGLMPQSPSWSAAESYARKWNAPCPPSFRIVAPPQRPEASRLSNP